EPRSASERRSPCRSTKRRQSRASSRYGINAAVFAVVDAALFRGFAHVQHNERLVQIGTNRGIIYYPDFQEWRSRATSLSEVETYGCFSEGSEALRPHVPPDA